ncbi:cytokinin riboside 5'-monophosphate phosphoribohydrolase [Leuconostoc litchii]|uniref:Cytokinin riboside 5'-monophosphate phosphoribohydrolase n=1 Tax=Leuconostoc litchii TaxID=1981069 RepID=A0A652NE22_9LACO|nr:TIGR00730 family Rossman fold protein [Leuconostoc litchii]TYC46017.1 TIGR00730 family Rossman fold protein [Leuconostoc litchii]GMA70274.1 cytokinin riboside 5'-monophosphate phosphoribohydrolase [Leuconostoc litchii]
MKISSVGVFMGSQSGDNPRYVEAAEALGKRIAQNELRLVYGAGKDGLMGATAYSAMAAGGKVLGISPRNLAEEAVHSSEITQLIEVDTMTERKQLLMDNSDVFIVLPGGFGTLEEIAQVISWSKIHIHNKPLALFNINGFYDKLWSWIHEVYKSNFVSEHDMKYIQMFNNMDDMFDYLENFEG